MQGFRKDDPLSCDISNFIVESVLRKVGVHRNGTFFYKSVQILAYVDDIVTMRDVTAAFSAIKGKSAKMGLAVNEGKTKYMLSTSSDVPRMGFHITANS